MCRSKLLPCGVPQGMSSLRVLRVDDQRTERLRNEAEEAARLEAYHHQSKRNDAAAIKISDYIKMKPG